MITACHFHQKSRLEGRSLTFVAFISGKLKTRLVDNNDFEPFLFEQSF